MSCQSYKSDYLHAHASCLCCPQRPTLSQPHTLTFSNCVPVSDTSNTTNNIVFFADPDINVVLAASFENTGTVGFNVNIIFNESPSQVFSVQPGDSISFILEDVREIALTGFSPTVTYTGIFNYQVTYTFEV